MLRRKMKLEGLPEQLFTSVVGMDPLLDGFSGVLVEIYREREPSGGFRYVLLETASGTGNQVLRFSSKDRELVYAALARGDRKLSTVNVAGDSSRRNPFDMSPEVQKAPLTS